MTYSPTRSKDVDTDRFIANLYEQYSRLMYKEIYDILQNTWDTEDVMQNAVIKLIGAVETLRTLSRVKLVNYIITTSRNAAFDMLRARRRMQTYSFDELMDSDCDAMGSGERVVEERLLLQMNQKLIWEVWRNLPLEVKTVLQAKYILKQSDEEISKTLGVKPSSVRMVLTRARRCFRKQLASLE